TSSLFSYTMLFRSYFDRYLQCLPSFLHRPAEICGYCRTRGQIPAAAGQDPGRPGGRRGRRRHEKEKEVVALPHPPAAVATLCGRIFFSTHGFAPAHWQFCKTSGRGGNGLERSEGLCQQPPFPGTV